MSKDHDCLWKSLVIFLIAGSIFFGDRRIGLVRLPDSNSRMHGGGITDTLGAGNLVILGPDSVGRSDASWRSIVCDFVLSSRSTKSEFLSRVGEVGNWRTV